MPAFVSLLRGINVGGNKQIRMEQLRSCYEALGLAGVKTHLQSGNVVFQGGKGEAARLAARLEGAIEKSFAFRPSVVVRTSAELRKVITRNPFPDRAESDPSHLLVMFLAENPGKPAEARLAETNAGPEEFRLSGRELYIYYPNGIGRSKLTNALIEKRLGTVGTARNWNTVTKLLELAEALEES
jgi:uncharacterized protein (DUF1697 family)